MEEGDVALNFQGAECVRATAIFVEVPSSATQHTLAQIGVPLLTMPLSFAPLALRGKFLIGSIPGAINCLNHARDMVG